MASMTLSVNGTAYTVDVDPDTPLLNVLRDSIQLNGPKFGCGLAECGACTVLQDGQPIRSCITPVSAVTGSQITSIEGLGTAANPHPIQQAFIDQQAIQCGYCTSGVMLYGKVFMDQNPAAAPADISQALTGILCRCYAHARMIKALQEYGQTLQQKQTQGVRA